MTDNINVPLTEARSPLIAADASFKVISKPHRAKCHPDKIVCVKQAGCDHLLVMSPVEIGSPAYPCLLDAHVEIVNGIVQRLRFVCLKDEP